ncbi:AAA family ATPase [Kribbella sp. NPDC059898]|uniref:AAA family ATPase n=1 Tax=Kribbella sp. NPDC059898 TaxID=3346995 RepID=UPI0036474113
MLVLLCGTSFSGKSTVARELARRLPARVVSLDEINERRGLWGGDGIPIEEWARTHQVAQAEVLELLSAGDTVVVDDTSSPRFLRDGWRALAVGAGVEFRLVYVEANEATVRARRHHNRLSPHRRDVTDTVLDHHLSNFEPPEPDEGALSPDQLLPHVPKNG